MKLKLRLSVIAIAFIVIIGGIACGIYYHQVLNTYEHKLFDNSQVHRIDIRIDEDDWHSLQENAFDKEKFHADVTVDGEAFDDVAVSAKGSNSMRQIVKMGSSRYSLKINFDKYQEDQTYYGLDKLDLNNSFTDPSEIKDYISFYMFDRMGVDAPLCSYAWVRVNGRAYGLFVALEEVGASFLDRTCGGQGQLYKPETEQISEHNEEMEEQIRKAVADKTTDQLHWDPAGIMNRQPLSKGADLRYTGDDPDNYTEIFDNALGDINKSDKRRVITALKNISKAVKAEKSGGTAGKKLESAVDTDEVIRYFAVHNFTNNFDSYTGGLNHNYYLYENEGQLRMIPWDYDFLNIMTTDASADSMAYPTFYRVSTSIDKPLYFEESARPMWAWIAGSEEYLSDYHTICDQLLSRCLESGDVREEITRVSRMIRPYVKKDPTKTYTLEDFDSTVKDLQAFCRQRSKSIRRQLDELDQ